MAKKVINSKGKTVILLNPAEKGEKYATELKKGVKRTNDGHYKLDKNKKAIKLTPVQRAYRSGYLDARKDGAKCYKANKSKKSKKG